jgi:hypothetical protein
MFRYFKSRRSPTLALRLTSLASPVWGDAVRPELLEVLLSLWNDSVGHPPEWFDIFGPYGIAKGQSIGLNAFKSKLKKRGHADYHGYVAVSEQYGGFGVSFFEAPPYGISFCEIVLWVKPVIEEIDWLGIVRRLAFAIPIHYGYLSDLAENQNPMTESRIRRGLLGGVTVDIGTTSLHHWHHRIQTIAEGGIRDIYRLNFLNRQQLYRFQQFDNLDAKQVTDDLYALSVADVAQQNVMRARLTNVRDFP